MEFLDRENLKRLQNLFKTSNAFTKIIKKIASEDFSEIEKIHNMVSLKGKGFISKDAFKHIEKDKDDFGVTEELQERINQSLEKVLAIKQELEFIIESECFLQLEQYLFQQRAKSNAPKIEENVNKEHIIRGPIPPTKTNVKVEMGGDLFVNGVKVVDDVRKYLDPENPFWDQMSEEQRLKELKKFKELQRVKEECKKKNPNGSDADHFVEALNKITDYKKEDGCVTIDDGEGLLQIYIEENSKEENSSNNLNQYIEKNIFLNNLSKNLGEIPKNPILFDAEKERVVKTSPVASDVKKMKKKIENRKKSAEKNIIVHNRKNTKPTTKKK